MRIAPSFAGASITMPDIRTKPLRGAAKSELIDAMMLVLREIVSQAVVADRAD